MGVVLVLCQWAGCCCFRFGVGFSCFCLCFVVLVGCRFVVLWQSFLLDYFPVCDLFFFPPQTLLVFWWCG
jgi:hypothetical protein